MFWEIVQPAQKFSAGLETKTREAKNGNKDSRNEKNKDSRNKK